MATSVQRNAFFKVQSWTDSTDYIAWVRGQHAGHEQLWELSLKRPTVAETVYDRKELPAHLECDDKGKPVSLQTSFGKLEITHALKRTGISATPPIAPHPSPALSLPPPFRELVLRTLDQGESVTWWGVPGKRALSITLGLLSLLLAVFLFFSYHWLGFGALCVQTTDAWGRVACLGLVISGAAFLGFGIFQVLRVIRAALAYAPIYVVTDRRVLVLSLKYPAIQYAPWEICYAYLKHRRSKADVLFPTQDVGRGNLWDIGNVVELERALSALLIGLP